jgi:hypothetical protein
MFFSMAVRTKYFALRDLFLDRLDAVPVAGHIAHRMFLVVCVMMEV